MPERRCLVAVVHNLASVYRQTCQSLMELGWGNRVERAKDAHGFSAIDHAWYHRSPRVDALRNLAAEQAIQDDYSHLLFLDADMIWPSDVLLRMLRHHAVNGVVSGLYVQKHPPYYPIALREGVERPSGVTYYQHDRDYGLGLELREEQVVGMGCTLIPTAAIRAIGTRPWFVYEPDEQGWPLVSEDVPFCRAIRAAGYGVWLDPTVKCGHVVTEIIDERHCRRWLASEAETARRAPVTVTERAVSDG